MAMKNTIVKVSSCRVFAPADFLESGAEIVITCGPQRNLLVFIKDTWNILKLRLADVPDDDTQMKMYRNLLLNFSVPSVIDHDHSFLLSGEPLQYAALKSAAYWIPTKNYVELWNLESLRLGRMVDWFLMAPSERDQWFLNCQNSE